MDQPTATDRIATARAAERAAERAGVWPEAAGLWSALLADPDPSHAAAAAIGLARALRQQGATGAAIAILAEAQARLPDDEALLRELAFGANRLNDWEHATPALGVLAARSPHDPQLNQLWARALRLGGNFDAAAQAAAAAVILHPEHTGLAFEQAMTATNQRLHATAATLWRRLSALDPSHPFAANRAEQSAGLAAAVAAALVAEPAAQAAPADEVAMASPATEDQLEASGLGDPVLRAMRSLGDGETLAHVQRHFATPAHGLLARAGVTAAGLSQALRHRFEGVGDPTQLATGERDGVAVTRDLRYGFLLLGTRAPARVAADAAALLGELDAAAYVFVYAAPALEDAQIDQLIGALRGYGALTALFVRAGVTEAEYGTIEEVQEGLFVAHTDPEETDPESVAQTWRGFCAVAHGRLLTRRPVVAFAKGYQPA